MYPLRVILAIAILASLGAYPFSAQGAGTSQAKGSASPGANSEWRLLGGNSDEWQHSSLAQINDKNVQRLGLAWVAEMGPGDGLVGNPLVADGVVYQSGPPGQIYANDLRTGKQLWTFYPEVEVLPGRSWTAFWASHFNRGLALDDDALFVASDCRLIAVNRKSGRQIWAVRSCDSPKEYGITGAPRVGGGKVFIGNTGGDTGKDPGYLDAYDAKTGRHLWRFNTMPGDPSQPFETPELALAAKTWGTDYWKYSHGARTARGKPSPMMPPATRCISVPTVRGPGIRLCAHLMRATSSSPTASLPSMRPLGGTCGTTRPSHTMVGTWPLPCTSCWRICRSRMVVDGAWS
jgi:glucose dehydrogenase